MLEDESDESEKKAPIYILTPQGSLMEITSKADILKSLFEEYKIDTSLFKDLLQEEIEDIKKELTQQTNEKG